MVLLACVLRARAEEWTGIICPALYCTCAAVCSGRNPASVGQAQGQRGWTGILCLQTTRTDGVDRQECNVCVFVWVLRQGASRWMSTPIIGHTEKILNFYLVWGSKALLVVKGNALSTLPSSSYHAGFCLDSKMKARHKKNNTGFLFLLYATAFKINFRTSANSLEVSLCVFFKVAINTVYIM